MGDDGLMLFVRLIGREVIEKLKIFGKVREIAAVKRWSLTGVGIVLMVRARTGLVCR